jgi:predicted DNA binding CopG/RHH family protein
MATGIRTMNLRFSEETFVKLKKKKDASGLTWEEWVLKIARIEKSE